MHLKKVSIIIMIVTFFALFPSCKTANENVIKIHEINQLEGFITKIEKINSLQHGIELSGIGNDSVLYLKDTIINKNNLEIGDYIRVTQLENEDDIYTIEKLDYRKVEGNIIKIEIIDNENKFIYLKINEQLVKLEINKDTIIYFKDLKKGDYIVAEGKNENDRIICYKLIRY